MNKEMLVEQVLEYVKDDNAKYAIMIDGPWGCGKTYLYENCLKREIASIETGKNNKDRRYNVYISLYGIDSLETLSKTLLVKYMLRKKNKRSEKQAESAITVLGGAVATVGNLVSATVPGFSFSFKEIKNDIGKIGKNLINPKNAIICFDDLERSTISIPVLMGYINNLIEHCGCKVIILADEKNIGKIYASADVEQKYGIILSGGRKLDLSDKIDRLTGSNNSKNDTVLSLEELKATTEDIFSDNYVYRDIKEKVVGKTLLYLPDIEAVIDNVVYGYKFSGLYGNADFAKLFLYTKRRAIVDAFRFWNCKNVRIILSWLGILPQLLSCIEKSSVEEEYKDSLMEAAVIYSICYVYHKSTNKKMTIEWQHSINFVNTIGTMQYLKNSYAYTFGFVEELIDCGVVNEKYISEGINAYIDKEKMRKLQNPSSKATTFSELLNSGWFMDDAELNKKVFRLLNEVSRGEYIFSDYRNIFFLLFQFIEEGILDYKYDVVMKIMIDSVDVNSLSNQYDKRPLTFKDENEKEQFEELYAKVEAQILLKIEENIKESSGANSIYRNMVSFEEHVMEGKKDGSFYSRHGFFNYLNLKELKKLLGRTNKEGIYKFAATLDYLYSDTGVSRYLKEDVDSLEMFRDWIDNCEIPAFNGKTGAAARRYLLSDLNKYINYLED